MWVRSPVVTTYTWSDAQKSPAIPRSYCGYKDWRLPNKFELGNQNYGLIKNATKAGAESSFSSWFNDHGFGNLQDGYYWTSTQYNEDTSKAWLTNMEDGKLYTVAKDTQTKYYTWAVRSTEVGFSVGTQADGNDCQNGEEVVVDVANNLMWVKTPSTTGYNWNDAQTDSALPKSYCGYTGWRLPSKDEAGKLFSTASKLGATERYFNWFNALGFSNIQNNSYWTSDKMNDSYAYGFNTYNFESSSDMKVSYKTDKHLVWAVRSMASPTPAPTPTPTGYPEWNKNDAQSYKEGTIVYAYNPFAPDKKFKVYFKCVSLHCQVDATGINSYQPISGRAWPEAWEIYNKMDELPTYEENGHYYVDMMVYGSDGHIYKLTAAETDRFTFRGRSHLLDPTENEGDPDDLGWAWKLVK